MTAERLHGRIGRFQLFALGFGPIIGSAWVVILGQWLGSSGPGGALIGFAAGVAIMLCVAACYAELTTRTLMTGGEFTFTLQVYGRAAAFIVGWFMMLCWVCVTIFEALALAWFAELLIPALRQAPLYRAFGASITGAQLLVGLLGALLIGAVNYRGSATAMRFQSLFTYGFLAVASVILLDLLAHGSPANLAPLLPNDARTTWWIGAATIFANAAFLFNGFQTVSQVIEERSPDLPLRSVGSIMLAAIVAAGLFYWIAILAAAMVTSWRDLADAEMAMVAATRLLPGETWLVPVLLVAVMASLIKTWNSVFLMAVRTLISLGREGMVPQWLAATDPRSGTPRGAVLFVAALNIAGLALGRGAIGALVDMSAASMTLCYVLCCVAVLILRRRYGTETAYRVPGGLPVIVIAIAGSVLMMGVALIVPLFAGTGLPLLHIMLLIWLALGALFWLTYGRHGSGER